MATIRNLPIIQFNDGEFGINPEDIIVLANYNSIADFTYKGFSFKMNILSSLVTKDSFEKIIRDDIFMFLGFFKLSLGQDIYSLIIPAAARHPKLEKGVSSRITIFYQNDKLKQVQLDIKDYIVSNIEPVFGDYYSIKIIPKWLYDLMNSSSNFVFNGELYLYDVISNISGKSVDCLFEDLKSKVKISDVSFASVKNLNKFQLISELLLHFNPDVVMYDISFNKGELKLALLDRKDMYKSYNLIFKQLDKVQTKSSTYFNAWQQTEPFIKIQTLPIYLDDLNSLVFAHIPISPVVLKPGYILHIVKQDLSDTDKYLVIKRLNYYDQNTVFTSLQGNLKRLRTQSTFVLLYKFSE